MRERVKSAGLSGRYLVIHPGGGRNPGMILDAKRYPPDKLARLGNQLQAHPPAPSPSLRLWRGGADLRSGGGEVVVIGAPSDQPLVDAVTSALTVPHAAFTDLTFGQIAALAADSALYIGNDTGMTHLAAAAGAKTVAIFGPTDPRRYAPFAPDVLVLWRPAAVGSRGVAGGEPADWDWDRDGIGVDEV
ncbi:MAG: glycosyltransferase family 9 protein, partial [Planctomycetota bacterium]